MLRRQKVHAIVLSRRNIGEADCLLTLFTRQHGILRVVAKGVRRIPSRRGGHLEPLTHVLALLSGTLERPYLAGVEPVNIFVELHRDQQALSHALTLAGVIKGVLEEGEPYEELFDAFQDALRALAEVSVPKRRLLETAVSLYALQCAGLAPDLQECQVCGVASPHDAVILDGREGRWRCLTCHDSFAGTAASLSPRLLKAARWLAVYPQRALQLHVNEEESQQLIAGVRHYCLVALGATVPAV